MGSRPTKTNTLEEKHTSKRQALDRITALLENQAALDALCRDLFESMSCDDGRGNMSRSRLKMLTSLVMNSCHVSDPSSLQELLDVLVPLHTFTGGEQDVPQMQMGYGGFVPHARCVLRVIVAVLQVELDGDGSEFNAVDAYQKACQDFSAPQTAVNGQAVEVPLASSRRKLADDRAVIITAEDLRDAQGSVTAAALVVEATMPDSVVPAPVDEEPVAIQDVVAMDGSVSASPGRVNRSPGSPGSSRSPRKGSRSPVTSARIVKTQILTSQIAAARSHGAPPPVLQRSFPMGSPPATPPLTVRAPPLVSLGSTMVASSSCSSLGGSLPSKPLRTSLSSASLGSSMDLPASVAASMVPADSGSRSRATTPRLASSRFAAPAGSASVVASANGVCPSPSSRSTTPRPVVRKCLGRPCSPQSQTSRECVPMVIPSATVAIASLPDLHGRPAIGRSHSPIRLTANMNRCSITTPGGALCVAPVPGPKPQSNERTAQAYLPMTSILATPSVSGNTSNGRSLSPLRPLSHLLAADVYTMPA